MKWIELLKKKNKIVSIILFIISFIVSYIMMELLNKNTHLFIEFKRLLLNLIIIILLNLFIFAITNKIRAAIIVSNSILLIIGVVNYFVVSFRGTPIVPWDFLTFTTATYLKNSYVFTFSLLRDLLLPIFLFILLIIIAIKTKYRFPLNKFNIIIRSAILVIILVFIICFYKTNFINAFALDTNLWEPAVEYSNNGFLASFVKQSKNLVNSPPVNYSVNQVKKIASEIISQTTAAESDSNIQAEISVDKPNIIVVQNESFADLSVLRQYRCIRRPYAVF